MGDPFAAFQNSGGFGSLLTSNDKARNSFVATENTDNNNNTNTASDWSQFSKPKQQNPGHEGQQQSAAEVYKQRLSTIYNQEGQQQKLPKLLGQIDAHSQDANWMHSLYIKVCKKYNKNPEPMVNGSGSTTMTTNNGNTQCNNQSGPSGGSSWGSSWGSMNNTSSNNSSGFGNMNAWGNISPQKQQSNNQNGNNLWSSMGSNNNGNSNSWGNWGNDSGNNNDSSSGGMGMSFASNSNAGPSWANQNLSFNSNDGGGGNNNEQTASDPFAAFANSGGFGSLLGS